MFPAQSKLRTTSFIVAVFFDWFSAKNSRDAREDEKESGIVRA